MSRVTCHVSPLLSQVPVPVYCELLAAYLASDPPNLTQAKFLVQRVPQSVRDSEEAAAQELTRLWRIGRSLWTRNIAEVYKSLEGPWSQPVQRIVDKVTISDITTETESNRNTCCPLQLAASLQQTNMKLVGEAYSSIKVTQLAAMLGVEEEVKCNDYL